MASPAHTTFERTRLTDPDLFRFWQEDRVRYADLDPVGHANNNAIGTYFENARVGLVSHLGLHAAAGTFAVVLRRTDFEFLAEVHYPSPLRTGMGIIAIGNSSITVGGGLFVEGRPVATHTAIQVLIDPETRRPVRVPDAMRANLAPYLF
ncbi:acyl-CoA thioesterase [Niveispirillum fermenti]|uniref:acyl-CoA thioesterase n=1 Tax=Niveispirillum fermenti TaxID=1233113 RepID=UPI003A88A1C7